MSFGASLDEIVAKNRNGLLSVADQWERIGLGDVASILNGFAFKSEHFRPDQGMPLVRIRDIRHEGTEVGYVGTYDVKYVVEPGDLLVGMDGDFNVALWAGPKGLLNQRVCKLSPEPTFYDRKLLYYTLPGYLNAIHEHTSSVTVKHLSSRTVAKVPLPLPGLPEQRRIVAKLDELFSELDAGVAALERAQTNLERYRASVLKVAVEGKLTEKWRQQNPPEETGAELLERILVERRKRWEEEQLARYKAKSKKPPKNWRERYKEPVGPNARGLLGLPEGWCWATLGQVARFQNGRAFPSKEYASVGVRLLRPGNLDPSGAVTWTAKNTRHMSEEWADLFPQYLIGEGELIMNLTAQSLKDEFLGRTCRTSAGESCLLNQRLARITPLEGLRPVFLLWLSKAHRFRRFVDSLNQGSLIQHMYTSQLDEFVFPLPPTDEQEVIEAKVSELTRALGRLTSVTPHRVQSAASLRQAILKRAFEGRLVPQDPNDEPASVLLERIRTRREVETPKKKRQARKKTPQPKLDL